MSNRSAGMNTWPAWAALCGALMMGGAAGAAEKVAPDDAQTIAPPKERARSSVKSAGTPAGGAEKATGVTWKDERSSEEMADGASLELDDQTMEAPQDPVEDSEPVKGKADTLRW